MIADAAARNGNKDRIVMFRLFTAFGLAAALALGAATDAGAWERKGSFTGPRGTSAVDGSGGCSGRACARSVAKTGPLGAGASRTGDARCADGTCSGGRTTTGPAGRSVVRDGSISR